MYFDPRFRHPQINETDLSLEQELGVRTVLTLTGMATDGHHLTQFIDTNIDLNNVATVFYSVVAPGNEGSIGPLGKASGQVSGYTNMVYQPQPFYYQRLNPAYGAITDMVSETELQLSWGGRAGDSPALAVAYSQCGLHMGACDRR